MSDIIEPSPPSPDSPGGAIPQARMRPARRFPIIWLIPLVAVAIGAWLAWDTWSKKGPTITISFESADGLQAGQSQLKFKNIVLGTVQSFSLSPDNSHVLVTIETTRQAEPLLTDQTVFWVVKPRLFAGNISGLETLLSGAYVGMLPAQNGGKPKHDFVGLKDPPVLQANVPGHTFLLKADQLGAISVGSPIFFRDLEVGEVLGWDIADMAKSVTIRAFVRAPYDTYVSDQTRFWNASGVSVQLGSAGVEVKLESLRALLLGGIAFETPGNKDHPKASADNQVFPLFPDKKTADAASYNRKIQAVSYFAGSVRGVGPGSEVTTHGLTIGHVISVGLHYDAATDSILAPVYYEVEPERVLGIEAQMQSPIDMAEVLVKRGMRASLQSTNLLTGQQSVALELEPNASPATISMQGDTIVLPTSEGSGLSGLQSSAADLLNKLNAIPFAQIGQNLNGILSSVNKLTGSGEMRQALTDLSSAIAKINDFVHQLNTGTAPAFKQLPQLMTNLQTTLSNVDQLFVSLNNGYGNDTKFSRDLQRLLPQLNETLRSIRSLADMLTQHPEALIKGRPAGGLE